MNTLCFTGHRKINGAYHGPAHTALRAHLIGVVNRAAEKGAVNFISGGALGVDTLGAQALLQVKQTAHKDINLIMARPFPSQASKWPQGAQNEFNRICGLAQQVIDVSQDPYAVWKMQKRNIWMVDQSNVVVAVWNGEKSGGTYNCIKYAIEKKKPVLVIHPTLLTETWY